MSGNGIAAATRKRCYERDGYLCTNPKCPHRDAVVALPGGGQKWAYRRWSTLLQRWVQIGITLHHCLWRSRYFGDDRDEEWNLTTLCNYCHDVIMHHPSPQQGAASKELEDWAISLALQRRKDQGLEPVHEYGFAERKFMTNDAQRERKNRERDARKKTYREKIEAFKKKNGGLSPSQVAYRRQKEWKMKNI